VVGQALVGRDSELQELSRLIAGTRDGCGFTLVLRGEAGIGRSAIIEQTLSSATALRVITANGVAAEAGMDYGALHRVLHPHLRLAGDLPPPQAAALEVIFGRRAGPAPRPLLVGLAAFGIIDRLARDQPILLVADDA
jgi:hypothetical protein